jgi:hypothetical protein
MQSNFNPGLQQILEAVLSHYNRKGTTFVDGGQNYAWTDTEEGPFSYWIYISPEKFVKENGINGEVIGQYINGTFLLNSDYKLPDDFNKYSYLAMSNNIVSVMKVDRFIKDKISCKITYLINLECNVIPLYPSNYEFKEESIRNQMYYNLCKELQETDTINLEKLNKNYYEAIKITR